MDLSLSCDVAVNLQKMILGGGGFHISIKDVIFSFLERVS